jgi:signal transduction histidine kinase
MGARGERVCQTADPGLPISPARQMKCRRSRFTVGAVRRLPDAQTVDYIAAPILTVVGLLELAAANPMPGTPGAAAVPLTILITAIVAVRRRWPLATGVVSICATAAIFVIGGEDQSIAVTIAWFCALYGIAVWTNLRGFLLGFGVLVATNALTLLGPHQSAQNTVEFTAIPGVAMLLCRRAVRDRQLRAEALAARAELLEREQQLRANEAIADERARIARELHDLVAHNVSVMVVQAGAERHALPPDQTSTRETLSSIEQSGRQALAEARRLLGMLRHGASGGTREELEPQPSIEQIDLLVEQIQRAGLPVALEVRGDRKPLPAGLDLCAYRVVQEALTNVLRHAGPARAHVLVDYGPDALGVEVSDDGRGTAKPTTNGAGHGLIGMRERVALYGGELTVGPRDGGGFEVRARLPLA